MDELELKAKIQRQKPEADVYKHSNVNVCEGSQSSSNWSFK